MLVEFGKSSAISKAKQQPDKLKDVLNKLKTDGVKPTIEAVFNKLQYPLPMGYCNLGVVVGKGKGVKNFEIGDMVISNGNHAEYVSIPKNLCAKIPDGIDQEQAVFTIMASISMQGIRLANPTIGEYFVVFGLGILGLITVQLLRANGCRVLGIDFDKEKIEKAKSYGADTYCLTNEGDPLKYAENFSKNRGVDAVLITAASKDNNIINDAAKMCRKKARIILVGVTGLDILRDEFYKKELTFQVSCSYGPGRYDVNYEEKGLDYPIGFVRWTQNRNFEAILDLISDSKVNFKSLISHKFDFNDSLNAYKIILNDSSCLGVLLNYSNFQDINENTTSVVEFDLKNTNTIDIRNPLVSFIGSGNYARQTLIPAFKKNKATLNYIASLNGLSSTYSGKKYGFKKSTTDIDNILNDTKSKAVVISTRHDSHSKLIINCLKNGKDVYVEKPMCITLDELKEIEDCYYNLRDKGKDPILMVGFNRRFSPHVLKIKELLKNINGPKFLVMTINAGYVPDDHWINDKKVGGGRIIGEVCHFIDLVIHIMGMPVIKWTRNSIRDNQDNVSIILNFEDGSIGTINYFTNGSKSFPKEKLEVFCSGSVLYLNNFKSMRGYGWKDFKKLNLWHQDKGHSQSVQSFLKSLKNRNMPISFEDLVHVSKLSIKINESANSTLNVY